MKHARDDYAAIQDPRGLIPEDEPVFLLRAQDVCAPIIVMQWAFEAERHGVSRLMIEAAKKQAKLMGKWQQQRMVKIPDLPKNKREVTDAPH